MAEGLKERERMQSRNDEKLERFKIDPPRFIVYIDGYNFYAAINHSEPRDLFRLGWCNFEKLSSKLVSLAFDLQGATSPQVVVKYFTSRVSHKANTASAGEETRQSLWLEALKAETGIVPILGMHKARPDGKRKEKWTDVNIAITMTQDVANRPSGMILISGDHDFEPVVEKVAASQIPVIVFCPHGHKIYAPPVGKECGRRIRTSYLTQEILKDCRLSAEKLWDEYLDLKIKSSTLKGARSPYQGCREFDEEQRKNRVRL
ncbi:MAG: NYN domain-containing protein [Acidobacteriota bacterium]